MKNGLPKRLERVAAHVIAGKPMADIGTDHAQLPIALVRAGIVPSAIAMDVVDGPLATARSATSGLRSQIEVRRSDGFAALGAGEAASVCLCGMGGRTMARILENGSSIWLQSERLILQPQGRADEVRSVMLGRGWDCIMGEIVEDRGKLFTIEVWEQANGAVVWSDSDLRWGKSIRERPDPLFATWLERELKDMDIALQRMMDSGASDHPKAALARRSRAVIQQERDRLL